MRRAARDGARGREARHASGSREIARAGRRARSTSSSARSASCAGDEFTIGSPQQLGEVLFEQARPVAQAPRQDRLLDRRARAAGDPRRARDHPEDRALARAHQARRPTSTRCRSWSTRDGRAAHHLQPDGRRHRPAVAHQPEPAEHPDPHRARARDPRAASSPTGQRADLGRLLAGRAARARAHRRRGGAEGDLRARRGHPRAPPPPRCSAWRPTTVDPGDALQGEDDQLRDRLRAHRPTAWPTGSASRRRRPQEFIDRYLERFPAVRAFIDATIEQRAPSRATSTTLFGRRRQIPELRARKRQMRSLGERLAVNTPIQGTAADIIKVAMVRAARALRDAGPDDAPGPADPRRAAVRGARGRGRAGAPRSSCARWSAALRARPAAGRGRRRGRELAGGRRRTALLGGVVLAVALSCARHRERAAASGCAGTSAHRRSRRSSRSTRSRARRACSRCSSSRSRATSSPTPRSGARSSA